jgi:enoyl-CoA hydratase
MQVEDGPVRYEVLDGGVARVTLHRPTVGNAQNIRMTMAIDEALRRAVADDAVGCVVLCGAGKNFSAGHDIGTPERDIHLPFDPVATIQWPHADKSDSESTFVRESEAYVGMCRRWRDLPKPLIASVHGACVAGGLMLAWICDLIVASDDAWFSDPVVRMGIPGVEFFAHPYVMSPRQAKAFLFLGERMTADEALRVGMINRVVPRAELDEVTLGMARKIAAMPRMGLLLTKRAINQAEDRMGLRDTVDATFGLHQFAHTHNRLTAPDHLGGQDPKSMAAALRSREGGG